MSYQTGGGNGGWGQISVEWTKINIKHDWIFFGRGTKLHHMNTKWLWFNNCIMTNSHACMQNTTALKFILNALGILEKKLIYCFESIVIPLLTCAILDNTCRWMIYTQKRGNLICCTCKTAHWQTQQGWLPQDLGLCSFAAKHASVDLHLLLGFHSVLNGVGIINHCHPHMGIAKPQERDARAGQDRENQAPCLQQEAAHVLHIREAGLVMSLKDCLHAVLSGCKGTGCRCKTKPMRLNITLMPWRALGGLPLQIERPGPPLQLKRKWLTISLLERNKQAVCRDSFSAAVDPFV